MRTNIYFLSVDDRILDISDKWCCKHASIPWSAKSSTSCQQLATEAATLHNCLPWR